MRKIRLFWTGTEQVPEPFRSALRVLLLTGQRLKEVTGMVDHELDGNLWTLGPDRTKNHWEHQLTLPQLASDILAAVPRVEAPRGQNFSYVFSTTGSTPISGLSKIKRKLTKAMGEGVPAWRIHDLRRSCASGMQRLGIRPEVIELALNHRSGTYGGIGGVYPVDPLTNEVAAALLRWSQHVVGLVEGGDKVVRLRAEAK